MLFYKTKVTIVVPSERMKLTWYWEKEKTINTLWKIVEDYIKGKDKKLDYVESFIIIPEWFTIEFY